ncbi:hypothetical protein CUJ83_06175 [Methanocella sp. CWC-04]|uniref:Uncharacterized protein n=1 Tax=Methanooceanicella nereidis TaxID=2052831 RepID=A0AAP2RBT7_9EURY|nr:DUF5806 family protein [Methanocella sp. CWC-04]MCD1294588.1 hypothetical protein [Methanocella sp. CWC-04]
MSDDGAGKDTGKYSRFQKFDKKTYEEVNDALKSKTHLTAREWAIARLCADFKDHGRSQMTWIGENLPELVPFMNEPYERQDVASAEAAFKRKVLRSGTTFFYAYYSGLISFEEMIEMVQGIIRNIEALKRTEGSEPGDVSTDVQVMMAETLKRITDKLNEASDLQQDS